MLGLKAMSGVRDIVRGGSLLYRVLNIATAKPSSESFSIEAVLRDACAAADVVVPANPETQIPDYRWWCKLCNACEAKSATNYGRKFLRSRIIGAFSHRLGIEEMFRLNGGEIEKEVIVEPLVVLGLPRSNGHYATHVLSRSGLFLAPRQCDTLSPSLMTDEERRRAFSKRFRGFRHVNPDFLCVRLLQLDQVDDDLMLHLMTPQCYAWGLLHGLDEYLLECIEEDQAPVYQQVKRTLQLFQWYKKCGHYAEPVVREHNPIDNPLEIQTYGTKNPIIRPQWLLYSPLGILSSEAVHGAFPDMRVIWVHRALAQCIPSLCSSLCLHNSIYTGKPPTESQLAATGEKVLGIFGSGAEHAIQYYAKFDQRRMVHWSNRDVKRHATRLAAKTLDYFSISLDRFRRMQMIDAQTEYIQRFRPLHDAQMQYFCLHEGVIGDAFDSYIFQFEEFAFEKRFGVTVHELKSLSSTRDTQSRRPSMLSGTQSRVGTPLVSDQPVAGHYISEGQHGQ